MTNRRYKMPAQDIDDDVANKENPWAFDKVKGRSGATFQQRIRWNPDKTMTRWARGLVRYTPPNPMEREKNSSRG